MKRRDTLTAAAAALALAATGCTAQPATRSLARPTRTPSVRNPVVRTPTPAPLPAEVTHGPRDRPEVALTFHGQGDITLVDHILVELSRAEVRVTVLAVGAWLAAEPAMAGRILDAGHELGNHTQNHRPLLDLPAADVLAEISQCAQTLRRVTGSIGPWFRPSQTWHATPLIEAQAAAVGYRTCLSYDVDSLDYTDPGPEAVVRNTMADATNGSIISLHFGHPDTVAALAALLDALHTRGLRPVTVTDLLSG